MTCALCRGTGLQIASPRACAPCKGTGRRANGRCSECRGEGVDYPTCWACLSPAAVAIVEARG